MNFVSSKSLSPKSKNERSPRGVAKAVQLFQTVNLNYFYLFVPPNKMQLRSCNMVLLNIVNDCYRIDTLWKNLPIYVEVKPEHFAAVCALVTQDKALFSSSAQKGTACWQLALGGLTTAVTQKPEAYFDKNDFSGSLNELGLNPSGPTSDDKYAQDMLTQQFYRTEIVRQARIFIDQYNNSRSSECYKAAFGYLFNITKWAFQDIVKQNGFEPVTGSPYEICMHVVAYDAPTFDHWWIRAYGITIEIFPAMERIQIYRGEQKHVHTRRNSNRNGTTEYEMMVFRMNVKILKLEQIYWLIAVICAEYLKRLPHLEEI